MMHDSEQASSWDRFSLSEVEDNIPKTQRILQHSSVANLHAAQESSGQL